MPCSEKALAPIAADSAAPTKAQRPNSISACASDACSATKS